MYVYMYCSYVPTSRVSSIGLLSITSREADHYEWLVEAERKRQLTKPILAEFMAAGDRRMEHVDKKNLYILDDLSENVDLSEDDDLIENVDLIEDDDLSENVDLVQTKQLSIC